MMSDPLFPRDCPACAATLHIERMACAACGTRVEGRYRLPRLARMSPESREIVELLVVTGGSLKAVAKRMEVSYPTLRKRLDAVIDELEAEIESDRAFRGEALERSPVGEVDP